jgi:hypothetical protein
MTTTRVSDSRVPFPALLHGTVAFEVRHEIKWHDELRAMAEVGSDEFPAGDGSLDKFGAAALAVWCRYLFTSLGVGHCATRQVDGVCCNHKHFPFMPNRLHSLCRASIGTKMVRIQNVPYLFAVVVVAS